MKILHYVVFLCGLCVIVLGLFFVFPYTSHGAIGTLKSNARARTLHLQSQISNFSTTTPHSIPMIVLGDQVFKVQLATTDASREEGLSGHAPLTPDTGMLFVFDTPGSYFFWMKDMLFPLDIVWLDADKHIMFIEKNLSPATYPQSFGPDAPALYVIEVAAGTADRLSLRIGDVVSFENVN